jgi:phosphopentomutase
MAAPIKRTVLITLDGVGIGAAPDAYLYGDERANTLLHVAEQCSDLHLPNLAALGLGNILPLPHVAPVHNPSASYGCLQEASAGKDTIVGHWELAGLVQKEPFATFPNGFPAEIIDAFRKATGLEPLGNEAASGTEIIQRLGAIHCSSGQPIVYTSVDSVFQIAAHEDIIPVSELYELCRKTRDILNKFRVARVIARPFAGVGPGRFKRTPRRHDFTIPPPGATLLDLMYENGHEVFGVGKIRDIFAGKGLTDYVYTEDNRDGMEKTLTALGHLESGLIFTNLVDFDMCYGHRKDARGFGRALEAFDLWLPELLAAFEDSDLLVITADHGCDPTTPGTDHTRELVPLLVYRPMNPKGKYLGTGFFSDVAAFIGRFYGVEMSSGNFDL